MQHTGVSVSMPTRELQQEVCAADETTATTPKCAHEAERLGVGVVQ